MIELPFPPASLSGHHNEHWRKLQPVKKLFRTYAEAATLAAKVCVPESGDIRVIVTFYPPDRRGDRTNYPNRCKPIFDGIADALKINDRRFLPSYHFAEPCKPGKVVIVVGEGDTLPTADLSRRNRILGHIDDLGVRKILVMRWWERCEITPQDAELLIAHNHLEAA